MPGDLNTSSGEFSMNCFWELVVWPEIVISCHQSSCGWRCCSDKLLYTFCQGKFDVSWCKYKAFSTNYHPSVITFPVLCWTDLWILLLMISKKSSTIIMCSALNVDGVRKPLVPPGYSKTPSRSNSMSGLHENFSTREQRVDISKNKFLFWASDMIFFFFFTPNP